MRLRCNHEYVWLRWLICVLGFWSCESALNVASGTLPLISIRHMDDIGSYRVCRYQSDAYSVTDTSAGLCVVLKSANTLFEDLPLYFCGNGLRSLVENHCPTLLNAAVIRKDAGIANACDANPCTNVTHQGGWSWCEETHTGYTCLSVLPIALAPQFLSAPKRCELPGYYVSDDDDSQAPSTRCDYNCSSHPNQDEACTRIKNDYNSKCDPHTGRCTCAPGLTGHRCTEWSSTSCAVGRTGAACTVLDLCYSPDDDDVNMNICNGGQCVQDVSNRLAVCNHCPRGQFGLRCEKTGCVDYCVNGGTCTWNSENATALPQCVCDSGFNGHRCQDRVPAHMCNATNAACANNGTCVAHNHGGSQCKCSAAWAGSTCQTRRIDACARPGVCQNGGICYSDPLSMVAHCFCARGFTGQDCGQASALTTHRRCGLPGSTCPKTHMCLLDVDLKQFVCRCKATQMADACTDMVLHAHTLSVASRPMHLDSEADPTQTALFTVCTMLGIMFCACLCLCGISEAKTGPTGDQTKTDDDDK
jgi:hypothetical protein